MEAVGLVAIGVVFYLFFCGFRLFSDVVNTAVGNRSNVSTYKEPTPPTPEQMAARAAKRFKRGAQQEFYTARRKLENHRRELIELGRKGQPVKEKILEVRDQIKKMNNDWAKSPYRIGAEKAN